MGTDRIETTSPSSDARLLSLICPNSYYSYPKLQRIAPIPEGAFPTLDALWRRAIHPGRDVNFYRLRDVFMVKEGLMFDSYGRLFDVTRTYHSDEEIVQGRDAVMQAVPSKQFPTYSKGIIAKSRGCANYGHFILEMLPRAWLARTSLGLADWPVVIDSTNPTIQAVSRQALELAGFAQEQIIAVDSAPIFFDEIVFVDGLTSHTQYLSPFVMQCLDAVAFDAPDGTAKAIYATRFPAKTRDFDNEPEIAARLASMGIPEVRTADLSFSEQISLFKGADTIVAVSGAALTNLVFSKPGTKIFNFMPCSAMEVLFWMIGEARRLDYREIRCPEIGPQIGGLPWDRLISVEPQAIEKILRAA